MIRIASCLALAAVALCLSGCTGLTAQQSQWLQEGRDAAAREQYSFAIEKLTYFLNQVDARPETAQALYLRGRSYGRRGDIAQAVMDLRACVERDLDPEATWRAYIVLGTIYYEDGRWEDARQAFAAAAGRMPARPPLDAVLFRLGTCLERTGNWAAARQPYEDILKRFPSSNFAASARRRLEIAANFFSIQCGVFAQQQNAQNMVEDLRRKGFSAFVRREPRAGQLTHVVLVGQLETYDKALRQLGTLRQVVPDAVIWP